VASTRTEDPVATFWHIAHPTYTGGDLICRDQLAAENRAPQWLWDEADEGFDGHVVCLFPDTPRGRTEADWMWADRPNFHLLRVTLPDDHDLTHVYEGYPAVEGHIPARHITLVHTGYAPQVATRAGDEY
jgi:hypothetical protein